MQLANIHSLRGIAILIIVFNHAMFFQFDWSMHKTTFNILDDLFSNGTVMFVFVSGYLFQYLLYKYQWQNYYITKIKNVVVPYIIISIPAILFHFLLGDPAANYEHIRSYPTWLQVLWYYAVGGAHINYPLWFIPMIILFFIFSPVFKLFSHRPKLYLFIIPLFILTFAIHREPFPLIHPFRQFIYFLPVYLLGMCACQYRKYLDFYLQKYLLILGSLLFLLIAFEIGVLNIHGIYETKIPFTFPMGYIDWLLIQKLMLCFFIIGLFTKHPQLNSRPLNYFAQISFAIFFLHAYFLFAIQVLLEYQLFEGTWLVWFARGCVCLALCVLSAWIAKKFLGSKSRYLIGY